MYALIWNDLLSSPDLFDSGVVTGRRTGRGDDRQSRALRRRVTLIYGGYRGYPWQSTHDSTSSGGRAV